MAVNLTSSLIACDRCRKLHISCSKQLPSCNECKNKSIECVYKQPQRRGPTPKAQLVLQLEQQIRDLNNIITSQQKHIEELELDNTDEGTSSTTTVDSSDITSSSNNNNNNNINNGNGGSSSKKRKLNNNPPSRFNISSDISKFTNDVKIYSLLFNKIIQPYHIYKNTIYEEQLPLDVLIKHLNRPGTPLVDDVTHRRLCNLFTMLSIGARLHGNVNHAEQFAEKARCCAKEIFDDTHYESACSFMCLTYYYFIFEESDYTKAVHYNSIVLQMCDNLKPKNTDIILLKTLALSIKSILIPDKKVEVCESLQTLDNPFPKIMAALTFAEEAIVNGSTPQIYTEAFVQIRQAEQFLPHCNLNTLMYLQTLVLCRALESVLNLAMGHIQLAIKYANEAAILFMKQLEMQDYYVLWWQLRQLQWLSRVHIATKSIDMLELDISMLERSTTRAYVSKSVKVLLMELQSERQSQLAILTNLTAPPTTIPSVQAQPTAIMFPIKPRVAEKQGSLHKLMNT